MNNKIFVEYLVQGRTGIHVYVRQKGNLKLIENVNSNIVRCAIGENDMEYLLKHSDHRESFCQITESDLQDFIKYSEN